MLQQAEGYEIDVVDRTARELEMEEVKLEADAAREEKAGSRPRRRRKWALWIGLPLALLVTAVAAILRPSSAREVTVVHPKAGTVTESIASNGMVGAATETYVGAQASGIVWQVLVKEGDHVSQGQRLAALKNDTGQAQVAQAQATLARTRAELAETSRPALDSEIAAANEQVKQAHAQLSQQRASVAQAEKSLASSQAQLRQREAERELAEKTLERARFLVEHGDYSRSQLDSAQQSFRVAQAQELQAQRAIEVAQASLTYAQEGVASAGANLEAKRAQLETTRIHSTPQQIEVARLKAREAEESLRVAQNELANTIVVAPFAGTVTKINAQPGQTVGSSGVLSLVSDTTEIQLNVDETNLADLRVGHDAIISSNTFLGEAFKGKVTVIAPAVNKDRGTIEVKIAPIDPPAWLRPGQTINVNIITGASAQRLLVPQTALARGGDRNVVFVVRDGRAVEKQVVNRAPLAEGVPIVSGLEANDQVISDAQGIKAGDRVQVR